MTCRQKCVICGEKFWDLTDDGYCMNCNRRKHRNDAEMMFFAYAITLAVLFSLSVIRWLNS